MKRIYLAAILLIFLLPVSIAQQKAKIEKSEFKLEKQGFDIAWDNIKKGDRCYELGGGLYVEALEYYLTAHEFNPENAALNYKMGVCSLLGDDPQGALPYFLKARSLNMDIAEDLILLTGRAYQFRGDYGKAIDFYNMYSDKGLEDGKIDPVVNKYINECNLAIEQGTPDETIVISNLGNNINSSRDDYSSIVVKDNKLIYFTSRRQIDDKEQFLMTDMKYNENIFVSTDDNGSWSVAGPAGENIATELNEGVLYVDEENKFMFVYAGWSGNGDILISYFENGKWTSPEPYLSITNSASRETSISITPDGKQIFFTSDRKKGSFGGRDIYYMIHIKKKKWSNPINLGPLVNSEGNEEAVWTSVTGDTIWFSSNGHPGFGAYDIFMSVRDESGVYSEAVNLGRPFNSQWNDLFFRQSIKDRRISWFSSDRPGGSGGLDIYKASKTPKTIIPGELADKLNR